MLSTFKQKPGTSSETTEFPEFGASALQSLTKKIDTDLKHSNYSQKKSIAARSKGEKKVNALRKTEGYSENAAATPQNREFAGLSKLHSNNGGNRKQKPSATPPKRLGQKRLRNGDLKEHGAAQNSQTDVNNLKLGQKQSEENMETSFNWREEIKALEGSEDDYALIAEIQSESEIEGDNTGYRKRPDGKLAKDLKKLVQDLGINEMEHDVVTGPLIAGDVNGEDRQKDVVPTISNVHVPKKGDSIVSPTPRAIQSKKAKSPLVFQPLSEWHAANLHPLPVPSEDQKALPLHFVDRLHEHAKVLLEKENQAYKEKQYSTSSSHQFYSTIMSSGTLSDKIGALTLAVQESPLHNMKALESLVGLARKRSRAQAVEVLGALKDLFGQGSLLPANRKLKTFAGQPAIPTLFSVKGLQWTTEKPLPKPMSESHLVSWAYEHWLKSTFFEILKIIENWCNDEVVFARGKAVDYVYSLLKEKPEQEANLLRLLVNKLGDPEKKIASKTSFNILQLEATHPSMKLVIISAIESDLLYRPSQSLHAQYYATITLNQTVLSSKEEAVAKKLLDVYFALFLKLLHKPDKTKAEVTGANVNHAVRINRKGEVQGGGGAGGKKAREKRAEQEKSTVADEDLREKILSAVLTGVNRAMPFTSVNDEFFAKHWDTLFRVTHSSNLNTSIQALMLIQQLQSSNQASSDRFYRTLYESLLDSRLLTSSKQVLYLNLLFRALRSDLNIKRIKAFIKRLLQVVAMHQPSFSCAVIYLLRELETVFPGLQTFVDQPEEDPNDDEEVFRDVGENGETPFSPSLQPKLGTKFAIYDGRRRDPVHANASYSTLWETQPLISHYHPSVSLFATRLLTHAPMPPKPDLGLNTLIHFLDRFVYKNPKTSVNRNVSKGISIMQPLAATDKSSVLVSAASARANREQPMNSEAFLKQGPKKVGADEVFFHRYFSTVGQGKEKVKTKAEKKRAKRRKDEESDDESEEDEDAIWKALVRSRPEVDAEGDGDGEEDGFSDMEGLEKDEEEEEEEEDSIHSKAFKDEGFSTDDDDDNANEGPDDEDAGMFDLADLEDNDDDEALLPSDEELRSDVDGEFEEEEGEEQVLDNGKLTKEKKKKMESGTVVRDHQRARNKRRKLKNLPTFASAEEYAKILGGDEEEEEGVA